MEARSLEASYNLTAQLRLEMMERRREEEVKKKEENCKKKKYFEMKGESAGAKRERGKGARGEGKKEAAEQPSVGEYQSRD